ncbi:hypothetical protein ANN_17219 [Periplaneta americana]|uniref:Uncharacterized protein n=1 Tax=Periplaneta americana TaxID=6978 RepID=A0ABQ8SSB6_PERAM|nr:hypothetical protein ANN_17219 [Periplaneta americana]
MECLCEGGNEPPGSLNAKTVKARLERKGENEQPTGVAQSVKALACRSEVALGRGKNDPETDQEEEKELFGSLAEKKLPTEGCNGRNGKREKNSGQKKISDDRRH